MKDIGKKIRREGGAWSEAECASLKKVIDKREAEAYTMSKKRDWSGSSPFLHLYERRT
jgi:hypothetical protein